MLTVADVLDDVKRVLAISDDDTAYGRLNDAVEILATESDWDPLRGYVDVCAGQNGCITLPGEVDTVLAVNVSGRPTQLHDFWFKYHLNGPGDDCSRNPVGHTFDKLQVAVYNDPPSTGARLICFLESSLDTNASFRVYGYDASGNWIRTTEAGVLIDGFAVPTVFGFAHYNIDAPAIARITRISKQRTNGYICLATLNDDLVTQGYKLGMYLPNDTEPMYRRIQVGQPCTWARVAFKRKVALLTKPSDLIFLHSRYALILMVKALKKFDEDRVDEGVKYQRLAVNFLTKKQLSIEVPSAPSIQVADGNLISPSNDRMS